MRITLDAGALCGSRTGQFGTHTFTLHMLKAFDQNRDVHTYIAYGFCPKPINWGMRRIKYRNLQPSKGWMNIRVPFEEIRIKPQIFMGLSQVAPSITPARIFTFLHGLSFIKYPKLYPDSYKILRNQLNSALSKSEQIFVSSTRIKDEITAFGNYKNIIVIPFGIPYDMQKQITTTRKKQFIFVGMNHPIKRVNYIVDVFLKFRSIKEFADYKLLLVGDFKEYCQPGITSYGFTSRAKLAALYAQSQAYVSASYYESFNFPVLEALSQGCEVVATQSAVIPEMSQFSHIVKTKQEFVEKLVSIAKRKSLKNNKSKLRSRFSWKKTVKIISSYY